ncbi:hypothetical protein [Bacillus sp. ISL-57]|nr:hypothetical protein [Bacillus sp. ISL-57]
MMEYLEYGLVLSAANRWVTEFENEATGLAKEMGSICAYVCYDAS